MSVLKDKNILLGVTGGIAAYKSITLLRLLKKSGADVQVIFTKSAHDFVTTLTFSSLSERPVLTNFFEEEDNSRNWNNHIDLAEWADFLLIVPATSSTISKMVSGNADNLLIATYLSIKCEVFFAPAMDLDMYKHESTKKSISQLQSFGNVLIPPSVGELASGLVGEGRLPEPKEIIDFIIDHFSSQLPLKNKNVLITAGPTIEEIDPVRFISNHSTGKMGYSLAQEAINLGANVTLISGPSNINVSSNKIKLIKIKTSDEMLQKTLNFFDDSDIVIMSAAVSDYKPLEFSEKKLKKDNKELNVKFKKTKDILFELGKIKSNQFLVGFALENENELENAKKKIKNKNLDLIVLNSLNDEGAGFGYDTNKVSIINSKNEVFDYDLKKKSAVAKDIFNHII